MNRPIASLEMFSCHNLGFKGGTTTTDPTEDICRQRGAQGFCASGRNANAKAWFKIAADNNSSQQNRIVQEQPVDARAKKAPGRARTY